MTVRPWHLEIRTAEQTGTNEDETHWWVAIVGGNGETVFTTETYVTAQHARDIAAATAQITGWTVTPVDDF